MGTNAECATEVLQEKRQEKAAERDRKQEERQKRLEQLEKQLQGLEQDSAAAGTQAGAGDQPGDPAGNQEVAVGDGAETPGDRSAPEDDDNDNADQDGESSTPCNMLSGE